MLLGRGGRAGASTAGRIGCEGVRAFLAAHREASHTDQRDFLADFTSIHSKGVRTGRYIWPCKLRERDTDNCRAHSQPSFVDLAS
jgi:hypothetical protein